MSSVIKKKQEKKAICSHCGGDRNCYILGQHDEKGSDEYMYWCTSWYLLKCAGCDHVFAQTVSSDSESYHCYFNEDTQEEETSSIETVRYWPGIASRKRPEWFLHGSIKSTNKKIDKLEQSLEELYGALEGGLNMLAAIGLRTSFDIAAEILGVINSLTFSKKLEKLLSDKYITPADKVRLEILVNAGSASAHRGWQPTKDELNLLMDVLEKFIHDVFVQPEKDSLINKKLNEVKARVPMKQALGTLKIGKIKGIKKSK